MRYGPYVWFMFILQQTLREQMYSVQRLCVRVVGLEGMVLHEWSAGKSCECAMVFISIWTALLCRHCRVVEFKFTSNAIRADVFRN